MSGTEFLSAINSYVMNTPFRYLQSTQLLKTLITSPDR